ncbi:MAG: DUF4387 family protein [Rhodobacteraceae bacterium]|nr:DUF4387 family protein [Paracoccaceae bacterium]
MRVIGDIATVRSKNAGPFVLTIDVFCHKAATYTLLRHFLTTGTVATTLGCDGNAVTKFTLPDLHVIKFSLPRPIIQGCPADRDMHGAQFSNLIAELALPEDANLPAQ